MDLRHNHSIRHLQAGMCVCLHKCVNRRLSYLTPSWCQITCAFIYTHAQTLSYLKVPEQVIWHQPFYELPLSVDLRHNHLVRHLQAWMCVCCVYIDAQVMWHQPSYELPLIVDLKSQHLVRLVKAVCVCIYVCMCVRLPFYFAAVNTRMGIESQEACFRAPQTLWIRPTFKNQLKKGHLGRPSRGGLTLLFTHTLCKTLNIYTPLLSWLWCLFDQVLSRVLVIASEQLHFGL